MAMATATTIQATTKNPEIRYERDFMRGIFTPSSLHATR